MIWPDKYKHNKPTASYHIRYDAVFCNFFRKKTHLFYINRAQTPNGRNGCKYLVKNTYLCIAIKDIDWKGKEKADSLERR